MEAMRHTPRERKSKSLDNECLMEKEMERKKEKKRKIRKIRAKREKGNSIFAGFWVLSMGRQQKWERGVRISTFSKIFTEIRLSIFVGARGKVHLCNESFT